MGYIVIFKRLAGIPNVVLLLRPMVHSVAAVRALFSDIGLIFQLFNDGF